ncbi:D-amino-acid transaminase [Campylobacter sp.]|uniref:D-amino-acid transaminase n=1 Tax=Campylobacter sp. TaxID=205 RepID=UPI00270385A3|nr:D-amino-acid transaminase [Campylobacter sp.]
MKDIVYLNGEFMHSSEAKVSALDRGFIFGDGIYEVVPVLGGKIVDKDDFWQRFEKSLAAIELNLPCGKDEFEEILNQVIAKNGLQEGGVYMQITRGVAERDFYFIKNLRPTCFVFCYEKGIVHNPDAVKGVSIVSVEDIRWKRRDIKSISLLAQCYAKEQAVKKGAYEGFMVEDGFVTEATSSSAFIIKDGVLITKPLSNQILPGIRRKVILGFAEQAGLKIEQRAFSMDDVYNADEVFICAATLLLIPVISADERLINGGKVGKYVPKLRQMYIEKLKKEAGIL